MTDGRPLWPAGHACPSCGAVAAEQDGVPMFAPDLADTVHGFDPAFFANLAAVEDSHFWFVPRNRLLVGLIAKYFPQATSFLEVGCGNAKVLGAVAASRRWARLAGSELHPTGLVVARTRVPPGTELVQMDACAIPAAGAFDVTGAFDVIEHIADDEAVLSSMREATRTGGGTVIAVPQHPWLWSQADEIAHHQRRYKRGELEAKLARNGFQPVFSSSYTSLLLPLMMLNRSRRQSAESTEALNGEFSLPPLLNAAFTGVLQIEVTATLAGLRWPAGGSRIVVARAV